MARRRAETLDDLLDKLASTETYEQFAARAGLTARALQELRDGAVARPRRKTRTGLAEALGVSLERVDAALAETRRRAGR